ncbi:MAG TPA: FAD-binding oxidoreductase, partial [Rhabdaerophilum sp.]|nr:FAD-binding oxidoreductase [Rhabdaerophilum sp.]
MEAAALPPLDAELSPRMTALIADLGDVPVITEDKVVRKRSRDFFWYSPILNAELAKKSAEIIVAPRNEADVIRVAAACAKHRVPVTPRGGATGNYGQAVPLHGGVLLDMNALSGIEWVKPGRVRVAAGMNIGALDAELRPQGWEMRMHPSTKRTATIGGFVAGGSGG